MASVNLDLSYPQLSILEDLMNEVRDHRSIRAVEGGSGSLERLSNGKDLHASYLREWDEPLRAAFSSDKPPPPPPVGPPQIGPLQTGTISFNNGVPVGGWSTLTLYRSGDYNFSGHFHDAGAPSYNDDMLWVVVDSTGTALTFKHSGHMNGTFESGSRDDDWSNAGHNQNIANAWPALSNGYHWRWQANVNWDATAALNSLIEAIKAAGTVITTVVAIVG